MNFYTVATIHTSADFWTILKVILKNANCRNFFQRESLEQKKMAAILNVLLADVPVGAG